MEFGLFCGGLSCTINSIGLDSLYLIVHKKNKILHVIPFVYMFYKITFVYLFSKFMVNTCKVIVITCFCEVLHACVLV